MTTCIIAEKPSVARDIARIVGANRREDGFLEGADYLVTWAFGHLITLSMPEQYGYGAYKQRNSPSFHNLSSSWCAKSAKAKTLKTTQPPLSNSKSSVPVLKKATKSS